MFFWTICGPFVCTYNLCAYCCGLCAGSGSGSGSDDPMVVNAVVIDMQPGAAEPDCDDLDVLTANNVRVHLAIVRRCCCNLTRGRASMCMAQARPPLLMNTATAVMFSLWTLMCMVDVCLGSWDSAAADGRAC